jgi:hypothetical protein
MVGSSASASSVRGAPHLGRTKLRATEGNDKSCFFGWCVNPRRSQNGSVPNGMVLFCNPEDALGTRLGRYGGKESEEEMAERKNRMCGGVRGRREGWGAGCWGAKPRLVAGELTCHLSLVSLLLAACCLLMSVA